MLPRRRPVPHLIASLFGLLGGVLPPPLVDDPLEPLPRAPLDRSAREAKLERRARRAELQRIGQRKGV